MFLPYGTPTAALPGHALDAFGEDVAHDLGGSAGDGGRAGHQVVVMGLLTAGGGDAVQSEGGQVGSADRLHRGAPGELDDGVLGARSAAVGDAAESASSPRRRRAPADPRYRGPQQLSSWRWPAFRYSG